MVPLAGLQHGGCSGGACGAGHGAAGEGRVDRGHRQGAHQDEQRLCGDRELPGAFHAAEPWEASQIFIYI